MWIHIITTGGTQGVGEAVAMCVLDRRGNGLHVWNSSGHVVADNVIRDTRLRWVERSRRLVQAIIDRRGLKAKVVASTSQREAVTDADFVITTFAVGGIDAIRADLEIPLKYGVGQNIGDTLGPGGVFRGPPPG